MDRTGRRVGRAIVIERLSPSVGGLLLIVGAAMLLAGCGDEQSLRLDPVVVALSENVAPVYDDGELVIYEAKLPVELPIVAPSDEQLQFLRGLEAPEPFNRMPWFQVADVNTQITFTLTNLDPEAHEVWLMIDPWNEFARYEPAIVVSDDEAVRDLSGIDLLFRLPGTEDENLIGAEADGRVVGTLSFDDMAELATDLATVFTIVSAIEIDEESEEDPRSTLVNHAFNVRNRSYNSPLLEAYQPQAVPGLVGFDIGIRTSEAANVALELFIEVQDASGKRLLGPGDDRAQLRPPDQVISSAGGP